MSNSGMAPRGLSKLTSRGVPIYALLISLAFALLSLLTSVVAADTLFMVLMAVSGMAGTVTWIVIALAQYRFRREHMAKGGTVSDLKFASPLFPVIPIACIGLCSVLLIFLAIDPVQRTSLYWGCGFIAACYWAYYLLRRKHSQELVAAEA